MAVEQETVRVDPYGFAPAFEEQVCFLLCSDDDFYRRVGFLLEPEAFTNPLIQTLARTVHVMIDEAIVAKRTKPSPKPPTIFDRRKAKVATTPLYVVQKLNQLSREGGRIPNATVVSCMDLVERLTDDLDLEIDEEAVIGLLAPELKRRLQNKAISTAIGAYRDRKEFKDVMALLETSETLGDPTMQIGAGNLSLHGNETYVAIEALQSRQRLPTGMEDLDNELGGGIPESSLLCMMGSPGAGKSVWLGHAAVESVLAGQFTLYATLEVEPEIVMARFLANISGVPIDDLHGENLIRARAILADVAPALGEFEVEMFEADVTKIQHIKEWVHSKEQEYGKKCKRVVLDYADYCSSGDNSQHSYQSMKYVYRSMYSWAHKDKTQILTASSTKEKKDKKGTTGLDEASDSRYKARIVDIMGAIDRTPEGVIMSLPKNRAGKSLGVLGPYITDFERGRMIRINRGNLHEYIAAKQQNLQRMWAPGRTTTPPPEEPRIAPVVSIVRPAPVIAPAVSLDDW